MGLGTHPKDGIEVYVNGSLLGPAQFKLENEALVLHEEITPRDSIVLRNVNTKLSINGEPDRVYPAITPMQLWRIFDPRVVKNFTTWKRRYT